MPVPAITPLTDIPSIADPSTFDPRADNLMTQQFPRLVSEINAAGVAIDQAVEDARAAASVAINGSSSTSSALAAGAKNFTVLAGHSWSIGTWLIFASRANPGTHWIIGQVTAYNGTLLTISTHSFGGSGSRNDWDISLTAKPPDIPVATTSANGLMSAADKAKVDGAAPLANPAFTGAPTAPTAAAATNTTQIATTAFVRAAIAALAGSAPAALDTLVELAAAMGNDPNFSATVLAQISGKLPNDGGSFTKGYVGPDPLALTGTNLSPTIAQGHERSFTNNGGNFTLNAPAGGGSGTICIAVTNAASGMGALNALGFNKVHGTFSALANKKQMLVIEVHGSGVKILSIRDDT